MSKKISVRNVGPVHKLDFDCPPEGGIVVLRGRNGRGKSSVISAVESAINPDKKRAVSVTDGEATGQVEAFGVEMRIGRRATRLGELEVDSLSGKLSVADLVDPGIDNPASADAKRIKALLQLAEVPSSAGLFYDLFGGEENFTSVVKAASLETDDLVELAARIKRDAEAKARDVENDAEHARQKMTNHTTAAGDAPLEGETDKDKLDAAYGVALQEKTRLEQRRDTAAESKAKHDAAKARRDAMKAANTGPSVTEALAAESQAQKDADALQGGILELEKEMNRIGVMIEKKRAEYAVAAEKVAAAVAAKHAAESYQTQYRAIQDELLSSLPAAPSDAELAAASESLDKARAALAAGETLRAAAQHRAEAEQWRATMNNASKRALELRNAAERIDEVLSAAVSKAGTPLVVESGRLRIAGTKRTDGKTNFGELSVGERYRIAIRVAVSKIKKSGRPGIIPLPQEAFESLDGVARQSIADEVAGTGIVILTASCSTDEELKAEIFSNAEV